MPESVPCPTCNYPMRFSRTIFQDHTEIWRCDRCGREVSAPDAVPPPDEDTTLVVSPPFRDEFARKVAASKQADN